MDTNLLIEIEEALNTRRWAALSAAKINGELISMINSQLDCPSGTPESTIYEDVIYYIKRLGDVRFLRKSGELKEAAFYQYAHIDKSTWSGLKWNQLTPSKKTVLKLILALKLSEEEARALLDKAHHSFALSDDQEDYAQDKLILALINLDRKKFDLDVDQIIEVLYYYQHNGTKPFDSIYDTQEIIATRRQCPN